MEALWELMGTTELGGTSLRDLAGRVGLVLAVVIAARVVDRILSRMVRTAFGAANVPSASILVNVMRALIWFVALTALLEPVFGIQPTGFIAALGVGSVALSLGMQDTFSNIFGGLTLMLSRQIEPGDVIRVGDFTGVVTDITWRSTSMRDAYGQVNIIPNSVLSKTAMVKLSDFTRSRCEIPLVITHGADLNDVIADIARTARDVLGARVDTEQGVDVRILGFDAAGIKAVADVHLVRGTNFDDARTMLARRLVSMSWVAHAG